jgi:hypothetical protein
MEGVSGAAEARGYGVEVTKLVTTCENGDCPTLYATDRDTLLVQGGTPADHGLEIPAHETLVEIPMELIRKAIRDQLI